MATYRWREGGQDTTHGPLVVYNYVDIETGKVMGSARCHPAPLENGSNFDAVVGDDHTTLGTFSGLDEAKAAVKNLVDNLG